MIQCKLKFENNTSNIFSSGSFIKGQVDVILQNPTELRDISFTMKGVGAVHWTNEKEDEVFQAEEEYANEKIYLFRSSKGRSETLPKGSHVYPISFLIPPEAPSSFEGQYGNIRYTITVNFNRPLKFDSTFTFPLTIRKSVDLNYESDLIRDAISKEIEKKFCCWPCASKPLRIQVLVPHSGYVPGEIIKVTINIYNKSDRKIRKIEVNLKKIIIYKIPNRRNQKKNEITTINKMNLDLIGNLLKETMIVDLLVISTTPSFSVNVIEVKYELNVTVNVRLPHNSPVVNLPILIGNVSLNAGKLNQQQKDLRVNATRTSDIDTVF